MGIGFCVPIFIENANHAAGNKEYSKIRAPAFIADMGQLGLSVRCHITFVFYILSPIRVRACLIRSSSAPLVVPLLFEAVERGHSAPSSIIMPIASVSYQDCPGFMLLLAPFTVKRTCQ